MFFLIIIAVFNVGFWLGCWLGFHVGSYREEK